MILLFLNLVWNITISLTPLLFFTPFFLVFLTFFTCRPTRSFTAGCYKSIAAVEKLINIGSVWVCCTPFGRPLRGHLRLVNLLIVTGLVVFDSMYFDKTWSVFFTTHRGPVQLSGSTARSAPRTASRTLVKSATDVICPPCWRLCLESVACFLDSNKFTEVEMLASECISIEICLLIHI